MNPVLIGLLGAVLAFGAGTWYGTGLGEDKEYAKRAREESIIQKAGEAAQTGAALAIAANQPINKTIVQKVQREIQTEVRFTECVNTASSLRSINEALTGRPQPASSGVVSGTVTVAR